MSPQPSRSPDRFSLAALAEDHPTAPAQGDESESLPCVNAQRGEPNLRVVDCSGARRDEEVAVEEVLIPYAHGSDPEDVPGEPPKSRWWLSSGAAVAMHVAIIGALVWVMPTPAELNLGHGELPKTMQVNFVQLREEGRADPAAAGCRAGADAAEDRGTQAGAAEAEAGGKTQAQAETQAQTGGKRHSEGQAEAGTQTQAGTRAEHGGIQSAQPVQRRPAAARTYRRAEHARRADRAQRLARSGRPAQRQPQRQ